MREPTPWAGLGAEPERQLPHSTEKTLFVLALESTRLKEAAFRGLDLKYTHRRDA